jgi:hypothetical protein
VTPPLVVIPRAEASFRGAKREVAPEVPRLRSEGRRHALERTRDGVIVISEAQGVLGAIPTKDILWAGFVEEDAILVRTRDGLWRAESPSDAVAGKLSRMSATVDQAATLFGSAAKIVVAAAPAANGAVLVSRDAGKKFTAWKRPAPGVMLELAVRSDGFVVAAIEKERVSHNGSSVVRVEIWTARAGGAWTRGPIAESYGAELSQSGDTIAIDSPKKTPTPMDTSELLALDARGRWISARRAPQWLESTDARDYFEVQPPEPRPSFPVPRGKGDEGLVLGMLGGLSGDGVGVLALAARPFADVPVRVRAFSDGVCDAKHVVEQRETIPVSRGLGAPEHDEERRCDPKQPAQRAPTLLLSDGRFVKLPLSCAKGKLFGTDRAAFARCEADHGGTSSLQFVSANGALATVAALPETASFRGSESASDGTTVLVGSAGAWVCPAAAPPCAKVSADGLLTVRALPGGRALIARRGKDDHELSLELLGEPSVGALRVPVSGNVLHLEVTAEGYVRLWVSAKTNWFPSDAFTVGPGNYGIEAMLVRADGSLVAEATR